MRLAFVSLMGGLPWGGSEVLWHATALHALKRKDAVFVSVFDWGVVHPKIMQLQDEGAQLNFRKRHQGAGRLKRLLRLLKRNKAEINPDFDALIKFKPDCVFINQAETFDFAWAYKELYHMLTTNKIRYSLACHSLMQQYSFIPPKQIYPEAVEVFKKAEHIFFVARRQWHLTERRLLCKFTNAHFTWNPLNLEIPKASLTWPNVSPVQMALVGAFLGHKGQDTALEVLSSSKWKNRDWQLNIYGSGEGEEYLQHLAALYGLQDKVFFHGHVKDIKQVWLQNHILLIPSSQEGLPISLVEAMACARPAVVTDVGGNTELITEDETGFVAVSPSTECYTRAMEKAWMQRSEWEQMGLRCFQQIAKSIDTKPEATLYEILKSKN